MKARFVNYYLNENYDLDWEDQDSGHTVNGKRMTNGEMLDWFREYGEPGEIPPEFEERLGIRRKRIWDNVNESIRNRLRSFDKYGPGSWKENEEFKDVIKKWMLITAKNDPNSVIYNENGLYVGDWFLSQNKGIITNGDTEFYLSKSEAQELYDNIINIPQIFYRMNYRMDEAYGQKDLTRMEDIKTKAGGDPEAEVKLATTQAKLINKGPKAAARAEAAEVVFGPDHPVTQIFRDKAAELGASVGQASKGVLAPVKGPAGKGERLEREWKKKKILPSERVGGEDAESGGSFGRGGDGDVFQKIGIGRFAKPPETSTEHEWRDASILPIGWVDLGSGESKHLNVYETWPDSTAEVWETPDGKYRLIFTAGTPSLKIGQTRDFRHDQTWKNIGRNWKFIDYLPVKDLLELVRVYGRAKFPGYTYK